MAGKLEPSSDSAEPQKLRYLFGSDPDSVFNDVHEGVAALRDWRKGWRNSITVVTKRGLKISPDPGHALAIPTDANAPNAVLLPGIWERWEVLLPWARALSALGFRVHFVPEVDLELGSLAELAGKVGAYLESADLQNVLVVAHSKGGLVAKKTMTEEQGWRISRLISCGTPFQGAPIAQLAPGPLRIRTLVPWNQEILDLANHTQVNSRIVAIEAQWDQNVPTLAELPGATRVQVPVVGHNQLLDAPEVIALIAHYSETLRELDENQWGEEDDHDSHENKNDNV